MMQQQAYAKLNLSLRIRGRLQNGLHALESLVAFAALADVVSYTPAASAQFSLVSPHDGLSRGDDNLVVRAHQALEQAIGQALPCHLTLQKNIPVAAGLGGGSADAAACLRLLVDAFGLSLPTDDLHRIAVQLGADVAVCLASAPAWVCGIGEVITPLPYQPSLPDADIVVVHCRRPLLTKDVFARLHAPSELLHPQEPPSAFADFAALCHFLTSQGNDLTSAACAYVPDIKNCLDALYACGAPYAAMSGSGAACFALVPPLQGQALAEAYQNKRPQDWCIATRLIGAADTKIYKQGE